MNIFKDTISEMTYEQVENLGPLAIISGEP